MNGSIGSLLTSDTDGSSGNPAITRDSSGDVYTNEGTCAPDNLSYDSPDSLAYVLHLPLVHKVMT